MTRRSFLPALGLALVATACVPKAAVKYDPFKVPRDTFYGSLKVVALAPMRTPTDLEGADAVKAKFEAAAVAKLQAAGLVVIPPAEVGPVLDAAIAAQGGIFDPATGALVEAKARAGKEAALVQLREKYRADALLRVDLHLVMAVLSQDVAYWDGVSERAGGSFLKTLFVGSHSGRIPALSLAAFLTAADGTELYAKAGGLRILGTVTGNTQEMRPHAELFADEARNAQALAIALDPLLGIAPAPEPR